MKIRLKPSLISILTEFNKKTEERKNDWICQFFHSEYGIVYDDKDVIFDVLWVRIEDWKISFICFRNGPDRFEFFSDEYFEIVDYMVPMLWGIGGFPKDYRFFYTDDSPDTVQEAIYYWSLPIFYSNFFFFGDYYESPVDKYQPIFDRYNKQLSLNENYRSFSEDEFYRQVNLIKQLP